MTCERESTMPPVVKVSESLLPYEAFLWQRSIVERAQNPDLVAAYVRWQVMAHGAGRSYVNTDLPPSGWDGYVVGLPPEQQAEAFTYVGTLMLNGLHRVCKQARISSDQVLEQVKTKRLTRRTAAILEPVFSTGLSRMRTIGQQGMVPGSYSRWRILYEQDLWRLEQKLQETSLPEKHRIVSLLDAKPLELRQKLVEVTQGNKEAIALYEQVHQDVTDRVDTAVRSGVMRFVVDPVKNTLSYPLPEMGYHNSQYPVGGQPKGEAWEVVLYNIPLLGNPLVRASLEQSDTDTW